MDASVHPVRAYRLGQNPPVTQRDLAKRIGTTKPNLSRIETGKQAVSEALLPKIIAETGISAHKLRPDLAKFFSSRGLFGPPSQSKAKRSTRRAAA